jgi:hypothetical protein
MMSCLKKDAALNHNTSFLTPSHASNPRLEARTCPKRWAQGANGDLESPGAGKYAVVALLAPHPAASGTNWDIVEEAVEVILSEHLAFVHPRWLVPSWKFWQVDGHHALEEDVLASCAQRLHSCPGDLTFSRG